MEAGYGYSIGIATSDGQYLPGCSVTSQAATQRRSGVVITYAAVVTEDLASSSLAAASTLEPSTLSQNTAQVASNQGQATSVALPNPGTVQQATTGGSSPSPPASSSGSSNLALIAVGGAATSSLCLVLLGVYWFRRRRQKKETEHRARARRPRSNRESQVEMNVIVNMAPPSYVESYTRGDRNFVLGADVQLPPAYEDALDPAAEHAPLTPRRAIRAVGVPTVAPAVVVVAASTSPQMGDVSVEIDFDQEHGNVSREDISKVEEI